jgi:cytoskeletal protein RodZ
MPVKKASRASTKKTPRGKKPMGLTSAIGPKATTMVVIIVMAGGIMVAARQQQAKAKEALAEAARAEVVLSPETAPKSKKAPTAPTTPSNSTVTAPVTTTAEVTVAAKAPPVTLTGCLERTDEGFRMTDTAGAEAPKSRSWKSGFLKKGPATLDVVDPARSLQLADHVGRRVSVTGTLVDREMRARSLRRLGACKAN